MKHAVQKAGRKHKFVPQSYATDIKETVEEAVKTPFALKDVAGLVMGLWPLRRYPRLTIMALVAAGIYIGMTRKRRSP